MDQSDYLDYIVLEILNKLSVADHGLRYTELKTQLIVSNASLVNRLNKLKDARYVDVKLMSTKTGRPCSVYVLTQSGTKLVETFKIPELLKKVENQTLLN